jgi:hypothetical protein
VRTGAATARSQDLADALLPAPVCLFVARYLTSGCHEPAAGTKDLQLHMPAQIARLPGRRNNDVLHRCAHVSGLVPVRTALLIHHTGNNDAIAARRQGRNGRPHHHSSRHAHGHTDRHRIDIPTVVVVMVVVIMVVVVVMAIVVVAVVMVVAATVVVVIAAAAVAATAIVVIAAAAVAATAIVVIAAAVAAAAVRVLVAPAPAIATTAVLVLPPTAATTAV